MNPPLSIGIFESICGGMTGKELPENFIDEGFEMLRDLCELFAEQGEYRVETCIDPKILGSRELDMDGLVVHEIDYKDLDAKTESDRLQQWLGIAANLQLAVLIAPEYNGQLSRFVETFEAARIPLLNCKSPFVNFASDKMAVSKFCQQHHIAHPPTYLLSEFLAAATSPLADGPVVLKPRDGAGSLHIKCFAELAALRRELLEHAADYSEPERWIVQRWVVGKASSRSVIVHRDGTVRYLPWMEQVLDVHSIGTASDAATVAFSSAQPQTEMNPSIGRELMGQILKHFDGQTLGWIGFDFVLVPKQDHVEAVLIEINPRLTTTFVMIDPDAFQDDLLDCLASVFQRD